jgi:transposase-like protein
MSTRAMMIRWQQQVYDDMRSEFEAMGETGRYCQAQKEYALKLADEYGVRATARILYLPRRTLQRWWCATNSVG